MKENLEMIKKMDMGKKKAQMEQYIQGNLKIIKSMARGL